MNIVLIRWERLCSRFASIRELAAGHYLTQNVEMLPQPTGQVRDIATSGPPPQYQQKRIIFVRHRRAFLLVAAAAADVPHECCPSFQTHWSDECVMQLEYLDVIKIAKRVDGIGAHIWSVARPHRGHFFLTDTSFEIWVGLQLSRSKVFVAGSYRPIPETEVAGRLLSKFYNEDCTHTESSLLYLKET